MKNTWSPVSSGNRATQGSVAAAAKRYRDLKIRQRSLPVSDQWTMAGELAAARAAWEVEREELALFASVGGDI